MNPPSASEREQSPQSAPCRLVLAEDHVFVRELMGMFLARERRRYRVVAETASVPETLEECAVHQPHVLVLDINLPGMSGVEAMPLLRARFPAMRVLICSGSVDDELIGQALRAGPDGFIEKTSSRRLFLEALAMIAAGGNFYCERSKRVLREMAATAPGTLRNPPSANSGSDDPLTPREQDVLRLIAAGKTTKEAASALGLSEGTIVTHRAKLMRKIGVRNAAELTRYAIRQGMTD